MAKWICKIIRDNDNNIIGYEPVNKVEGQSARRKGDYAYLHDSGNVKIPMVIATEKGFTIIENDNAISLKDAYEQMDNEIKIEVARVIGTTNESSLFAFIDAYQLRMIMPDRYIALGLKAEIGIGTFTKGDALDNKIKIFDYYSEVLFHLDTHRIGKIKTYLETKATLGF